jgi:hypothetical protein
MKKNANDKLSYWMDGISNMKLGEKTTEIGCDFCNGDNLPSFEFEIEIMQYGGEPHLRIEDHYTTEYFKIKFCPMCGRKLK